MIASLYLDVFCDSSNVINWQYALFTETKMHVAATEGIGGGEVTSTNSRCLLLRFGWIKDKQNQFKVPWEDVYTQKQEA